MRHRKILFLCRAAVIAAFYVTLTLLCTALGISSGVIQVRLSEMLCVLPVFTPAAIPGLAIGCILSNLIMGSSVIDVVFGSFATFIGAVFTYLLRNIALEKKHMGFIASIPPILANTIIIPVVLYFTIDTGFSIYFMMLTVAVGEIAACGALGTLLLGILKKYRHRIGIKF